MLGLLCYQIAVCQCLAFGDVDMDRSFYDFYDVAAVIGQAQKPSNIRHIREAGWSKPAIADDQYPWPGHGIHIKTGPVNRQMLLDEARRASATFAGRTDLTQGELFRHPVGAQQFLGDPAEIEKAQRVKVSLLVDCRLGGLHFTGLYAAPGELITIEVPEVAIGRLTWNMNLASKNYEDKVYIPEDPIVDRLPELRVDNAKLSQKVNKVGWPFGGGLWIGVPIDSLPCVVEVNISGGILCPWFRYGIDSDDEWREEIRHRPGIVAVFETGNLHIITPAETVRRYASITDGLRFMRSCKAVMDSTIPMAGGGPRWNGRDNTPLYWYIDQYVPAGAAVAIVNARHCVFPLSWAAGSVNLDDMLYGCWGQLHEAGHHHQNKWAVGDTGEVTNNVFCTLCYIYFTPISGTRREAANGGYSFSAPDGTTLGGWSWVVHPYCVMSPQGNPLWEFVLWPHAFGPDKMREFMRADYAGQWYDNGVYGRNESYLLRASRIFGYDMRPHAKFIGWNNSALNQTSLNLIDGMNLKPWYPISNIYMTGYEVNGKVIETALPFEIPCGDKKIFNFTQYTVQRAGQGKFQFQGVTSSRMNAWRSIEPGVYEYTPLDDVYALDEYRVSYLETETNQITTCYGKIRQLMFGNDWRRYNNIRPSSGYYSPVAAYNITKTLSPNATGKGTGVSVEATSNAEAGILGSYVTVCHGKLVTDYTGEYTFYSAPDDAAAFYLSKEPLTFDADKDAPFLLLEDDHDYHAGYNVDWGSTPINLTRDQVYYFAFIVYNHNGAGGGKLGYRVNNEGNPRNVRGDWVLRPEADKSKLDQQKFKPKFFEEIPGQDKWLGGSMHTAIYNFSRRPLSWGTPDDNSAIMSINNLADGSDTTGWISAWTTRSGPKVIDPLPHTFDIDLGGVKECEVFKLKNMANVRDYRGYIMESDISILCDEGLENLTEVFSGFYDSRVNETVDFGRKLSCSMFRIIVHNNKNVWSGSFKEGGGSCWSEIAIGTPYSNSKVVPISSSRVKLSPDGWRKEKYGSYWNGFGRYGRKCAVMEYKLAKGNDEIGILGDKFPSRDAVENLATVYIDGVKAGVLSPNPSTVNDNLGYSRTSYRQILFYKKGLNSNVDHQLRIVVESGEVGIAGFLVKDSEATAADPGSNPANPCQVVPSATPRQTESMRPMDPTNDEKGNKGGTNVGAVVGGVIGGIVAVAAVVAVVVIVIRRRKKSVFSDEIIV